MHYKTSILNLEDEERGNIKIIVDCNECGKEKKNTKHETTVV